MTRGAGKLMLAIEMYGVTEVSRMLEVNRSTIYKVLKGKTDPYKMTISFCKRMKDVLNIYLDDWFEEE